MMPTLPKTRQSLKLIVLDTLLTTLCLLDISWFFVIGPLFSLFHDPLQIYVAASYPFLDIILILAVALLINQRIDPIL